MPVNREIHADERKGEREGAKHYVTEDDHIFVLHQKKKKVVYLRCKLHDRYGCKARLHNRDGKFYLTGQAHTHGSQKKEIRRIEVVNECVKRAGNTGGRLKLIFDQVRLENPDVVIGFDQALETRMQRARKKLQPPNPQTLHEFEKLLRDYPEKTKAHDDSNFYYGPAIKAGGQTAFLFISMGIISLLSSAKQLHSDGTFKSVPKLFNDAHQKCGQLYTLHVKAYGKTFPFAYVLMTGKSRELYDAVLVKVKEVIIARVPNAFSKIELMISDFEPAIRHSMEAAFPGEGVRARGCWFHYGQAIFRYVQDLELVVAYREKGVVYHIVKMLIAIALLPHDKIQLAYQFVKDSTSDFVLVESAEVQAKVEKLFQYFASYWLGTVYPINFSVFNDPDRTNNAIESWNRTFNTLSGVAHGNIWATIANLIFANGTACRNLEAIRSGLSTTRNRAAKLKKVDVQIKNLWDGLGENPTMEKIEEFLEMATNFFEPDRELPRPRFDVGANAPRDRQLPQRTRAGEGQERARPQQQQASPSASPTGQLAIGLPPQSPSLHVLTPEPSDGRRTPVTSPPSSPARQLAIELPHQSPSDGRRTPVPSLPSSPAPATHQSAIELPPPSPSLPAPPSERTDGRRTRTKRNLPPRRQPSKRVNAGKHSRFSEDGPTPLTIPIRRHPVEPVVAPPSYVVDKLHC